MTSLTRLTAAALAAAVAAAVAAPPAVSAQERDGDTLVRTMPVQPGGGEPDVVFIQPAEDARDGDAVMRTMPVGEPEVLDPDAVFTHPEATFGNDVTFLEPGDSNVAVTHPEGAGTGVTFDTGTPDAGTPADPSAGARESFSTLSAALVDRFADRQGVTVEAFLAAGALDGPSVLPGVDTPMDAASLDERLRAGGLSFDGAQVGSLQEWMAGLSATPSADSAVALQAARWADQALGTSMPALSAPASLGDATLSEESLMFGLFAKESLTDLIAHHPDVFDQVASTGLGTAAGQQAFRDTMLLTWDRLDEGLSAGLLDGCAAGFVSAMASGQLSGPAGDSCGDGGGCAAAGLGAHHLMNRLFDFGTGANSTLFEPGDGLLAVQEWVSLQDWVAGAVVDATPEAVAAPQTLPSSACTSGGAADTVATTLPGVFSGLTD